MECSSVSARSAGDVAAAVDAPPPARLTAAAIAAVAVCLGPAARARRRSAFAQATRDRTALSLAERLRRLTTYPVPRGRQHAWSAFPARHPAPRPDPAPLTGTAAMSSVAQ